MKKTIINHKHRKAVQTYWDNLGLEGRVKALRDQGIDLPHSITFQDKEVAYLTGK